MSDIPQFRSSLGLAPVGGTVQIPDRAGGGNRFSFSSGFRLPYLLNHVGLRAPVFSLGKGGGIIHCFMLQFRFQLSTRALGERRGEGFGSALAVGSKA